MIARFCVDLGRLLVELVGLFLFTEPGLARLPSSPSVFFALSHCAFGAGGRLPPVIVLAQIRGEVAERAARTEGGVEGG